MRLVHFQNRKNDRHLNWRFRLMIEYQQLTQTARGVIRQRYYMEFETTLYTYYYAGN